MEHSRLKEQALGQLCMHKGWCPPHNVQFNWFLLAQVPVQNELYLVPAYLFSNFFFLTWKDAHSFTEFHYFFT